MPTGPGWRGAMRLAEVLAFPGVRRSRHRTHPDTYVDTAAAFISAA